MGNYSDETSQYTRGEGDKPKSFGRSNAEIAADKDRSNKVEANYREGQRTQARDARMSAGQGNRQDHVELGMGAQYDSDRASRRAGQDSIKRAEAAESAKKAGPDVGWEPDWDAPSAETEAFFNTPADRGSNPKRSFGSRLLGHFRR